MMEEESNDGNTMWKWFVNYMFHKGEVYYCKNDLHEFFCCRKCIPLEGYLRWMHVGSRLIIKQIELNAYWPFLCTFNFAPTKPLFDRTQRTTPHKVIDCIQIQQEGQSTAPQKNAFGERFGEYLFSHLYNVKLSTIPPSLLPSPFPLIHPLSFGWECCEF